MSPWVLKFEKIRQKINRSLNETNPLQGRNPWVDQFIFKTFDEANEWGKSVSTAPFKRWVYNKSLAYLLKEMPSYDSAQPLLGSVEEEALFLSYKKKRFLSAAKPGDVLLVRGNQRISRIIQTLTTSPYSHSAYYLGEGKLLEVEPEGVIISSVDKYIHLDLRLCRPVLIKKDAAEKVHKFMLSQLKKQPRYDVTNIEKLLFKYIYTKVRPDTKVYIGGNTQFEQYYICSGLIAHAFHRVGYPITPSLRFHRKRKRKSLRLDSLEDYIQFAKHWKKNFSQVVPSDFDNSPFFATVKFMYLDGSCTQSSVNWTLEPDPDVAQL